MVGTGPDVGDRAETGRWPASRGVTFHRSAVELQTWLTTHPGEVEGTSRRAQARPGIQRRVTDRAFGRRLARRDGQDHQRGGRIRTPSPALDAGERARIVDAATTCLEALGVDRGLFHTEVILDNDGAAHVVETHLRGGGDNILDLVRSSTGLDLPSSMSGTCSRVSTRSRRRPTSASSSQFAFPVEFGVILGWDAVEEARSMPGVEAVTTLLNVGERVSPKVTSSYGRSVCALAHADDPVKYKRARAAALTPQPVVEPV